MLNNLTQPHEYPGKLFVVEGIDGSGKDDAAGAAGEVAERRRAPRVRHRMELVRPREGGDQRPARRKTR